MREVYEIATLTHGLLDGVRVADAATRWAGHPQAARSTLGCWRTEIGPLGRTLLLRRFDDAAALAAERRRALMSPSPFDAPDSVTGLEMESFAPFPFLPPMAPDPRDAVFEFRTYRLRPAGLPPTLAGWKTAIDAAQPYCDHLRINLFALDGAPRIVHVWGFDSLEQRAALRQAAYASGVWPPRGGPENILDATSTIALRHG